MPTINYNNLVPLHVDKVTGKLVAAHKATGTGGNSGNSNALARVDVINGELIMTYTNGTTESAGQVGGSGSGVSVIGASINTAGELILALSDNTTINVGVVRGEPGLGIIDSEINPSGHLLLTLSDNSVLDVGRVVGLDGAAGTDGTDGVSVTDVSINASGDLVVTLSDGSIQNAGQVKGESGDDGATVLIELTTNGTHKHSLSISVTQALSLIDGSLSSVIIQSTEVDGHTHDVTIEYVAGEFRVTDIADNHLHGFLVIGSGNSGGGHGHRHSQETESSSWIITHNQGTTNALTQVYIENELVIPTGIRFIDINTIEVFFNEPQVGFSNTIFFTQT